MYKIEKTIPLPTPWRKYPFAIMEVGDSLFGDKKMRMAAVSYTHLHKKSDGKRFISRQEREGFRVWRIA